MKDNAYPIPQPRPSYELIQQSAPLEIEARLQFERQNSGLFKAIGRSILSHGKDTVAALGSSIAPRLLPGLIAVLYGKPPGDRS